jgi:hypothetical protein
MLKLSFLRRNLLSPALAASCGLLHIVPQGMLKHISFPFFHQVYKIVRAGETVRDQFSGFPKNLKTPAGLPGKFQN